MVVVELQRGTPQRIPVKHIKEIRVGDMAMASPSLKFLSADPKAADNLMAIVIVYGQGFTLRHLCLTTTQAVEYLAWSRGLTLHLDRSARNAAAVDAGSHHLQTLVKRHWLALVGKQANADEAVLPANRVSQFVQQLSLRLPQQRQQQLLEAACAQSPVVDQDSFARLYDLLLHESDKLQSVLPLDPTSGLFTKAVFDDFVKNTQLDPDMVSYEAWLASQGIDNENQATSVVLLRYLHSKHNDIWDPAQQIIPRTLDEPLSHYFISSSHNTYLTGDQLKSKSSVEAYARCLQKGCRCVELDLWDGPDEPIITHGGTFTSKIPLRDVCRTISLHAFVKSPYPLVLSLESHLSYEQQEIAARIFIEELGSQLLQEPLPGFNEFELPSPTDLKFKIILKGKRSGGQDDEAVDGEAQSVSVVDPPDSPQAKPRTSSFTRSQSADPESRVASARSNRSVRLRSTSDASRHLAPHPPPRASVSSHASGHESLDSSSTTTSRRRQSRMSETRIPSSLGAALARNSMALNVNDSASATTTPLQQQQQRSPRRSTMVAKAKTVRRVHPALERLFVYCQSVHMSEFTRELYACYEIGSFKESKFLRAIGTVESLRQAIDFNEHCFTRVYPDNIRVNSSNFDPLPMWQAGCQFVALNFQTLDRHTFLNEMNFRQNGGCGYVLKPEFMCIAQRYATDIPPSTPVLLKLTIVAGWHLFRADAFLPTSPAVEVELLAGVAADQGQKYKTRVVPDNGFNPCWIETMRFTVNEPELCFLRITVTTKGDLLGQTVIPVQCIRPGLRSVTLYDAAHEPIEVASLLVDLKISECEIVDGVAKSPVMERPTVEPRHLELHEVALAAVEAHRNPNASLDSTWTSLPSDDIHRSTSDSLAAAVGGGDASKPSEQTAMMVPAADHHHDSRASCDLGGILQHVPAPERRPSSSRRRSSVHFMEDVSEEDDTAAPSHGPAMGNIVMQALDHLQAERDKEEARALSLASVEPLAEPEPGQAAVADGADPDTTAKLTDTGFSEGELAEPAPPTICVDLATPTNTWPEPIDIRAHAGEKDAVAAPSALEAPTAEPVSADHGEVVDPDPAQEGEEAEHSSLRHVASTLSISVTEESDSETAEAASLEEARGKAGGDNIPDFDNDFDDDPNDDGRQKKGSSDSDSGAIEISDDMPAPRVKQPIFIE